MHHHLYSVSDDIDEADLDAELAGLEDELEGLDVEEAPTGETASAAPAYLQPCKSLFSPPPLPSFAALWWHQPGPGPRPGP